MNGLVDAHHHLWDLSSRDYPFLRGEALAPIRRTYDTGELIMRTRDSGVESTVLVQTVSDAAETQEFLVVAAEPDNPVAGVVGWVDLTARSVAESVAWLKNGPGGNQLVGVRHQVQDEDDARWLCRDQVRRGLAAVAEAGLVYDLLVLTHQMPAAVETVQALPEATFVLDHAAKPPIASGYLDAWSSGLSALAAHDNVFCKISGLVTEADWTSWTDKDLRPVVDRVLELFGPDRVLWGSDWPVCELAASYPGVLDATRATISGLSAVEQQAVLGGNARRVYSLT
ncbi:MAG: amidohydrolase family protein [Nocardioidaceae bacterium]